ncbi:MAG TPA: HAMP domain-containing sensor histidine kinase [Symbiobacteriaceae bacterium]|nr:HAMP domain-containing sensor histidine kinase [Symbiobacteriaceae bacterium]
MKGAYRLRGLFLIAALVLFLLPLVALGGGLVGALMLNQPALEAAGDEIHALEGQITAYTASLWDLIPNNREAFAEGLYRLAPDQKYAVEIRTLEDKLLYASPGVTDGEYHGTGISLEPTQRVALVRRDGKPVGVIHAWIWWQTGVSTVNRALAIGLWAGAATLVLILLLLLRTIGRSILEPLRWLERATGAVAEGSLDFSVPESRVQELATLNRGFLTMRDRLQAALDRQQALENERRRFIAAVGHDLRTPLSSVRAYAEGLRDGLARDPEKAARYGEVILTKTKELERLVEELFEYARLDLPGAHVQLQPVDAAQYLGAAVQALEPQATEKRIALTATGPQLTLQVDPDLFVRALDNLLANALRHTPEGGAVSLAWAPREGGGALITVADNGEGIPPEELPHLFSPLHRTDRSRSRRSGGAGLGLAITARIVALHGGEITCESTVGHGTRFAIRLPEKSR